MVLAISFVEAPLKFRAPGVTVPIGLGIGRLVFRALNAVELMFALVLLSCLASRTPPVAAGVAAGLAVAALAAQLLLLRPVLARRTHAVLAGQDPPRSPAHLGYVALEFGKLVALLIGGVLLLTS
ncbi:hypothetical protein OOZ19_13100 [Saccharopolyspora sp. NFXS83]|uniref:hypothetical protein n=1 Tax=Saccharopolyspora sp. NFXS83 TaxID=2993560 RepID=UPI00224ACF8E|nr:hypothetical protein [Saccharopolyspora sp. NFXS83]MCX2731183.1 hypothetical protein [Saccharopolyspora sp. NFXS83]